MFEVLDVRLEHYRECFGELGEAGNQVHVLEEQTDRDLQNPVGQLQYCVVSR